VQATLNGERPLKNHFFVIPSNTLKGTRDGIQKTLDMTGFRIALRLSGMTVLMFFDSSSKLSGNQGDTHRVSP